MKVARTRASSVWSNRQIHKDDFKLARPVSFFFECVSTCEGKRSKEQFRLANITSLGFTLCRVAVWKPIVTSGSFLTTAQLTMDHETNQGLSTSDHEMDVDMPQQNSESESSMSGVEFDLRSSASISQQNPADCDKSDDVDAMETSTLTTLSERRLIAQAVFVFKVVNDLDIPCHLSNLIQAWLPEKPIRCLALRDSRTIRLPRFKSSISCRSPLHTCFSFWNSLSKDMRQAPSVGSLQTLISSHLFK